MTEAVDTRTGEIVAYEDQLAKLADIGAAIKQARDLDSVLEIRDLAKAAESYGKSKGYAVPMVNHATEILARAERRLGELLPNAIEHGGDRHSESRSRAATLSDLGLTRSESSRAQRLASLPAADFDAAITEVTGKGEELTRAELHRRAKHHRRERTKRDRATSEAATMPGEAVVAHAKWEDWLPGQPDCDLLLTDPPYSTDVGDVALFAAEWLPVALGKVKPSGRAYVCVGAYPDELAAYLAIGPPEHVELAQVLVWTYRNTLGPAPKLDYKLNWQAVLYYRGREAGPLDCPEMTEQFSVADIAAPDGRHGNRWYEWQKPDQLAERFVRHATREGDVVLDPFAGSGSFLLAAARLGRQARGCEVDYDAVATAVERGCRRA